jgi:hypothetical protein
MRWFLLQGGGNRFGTMIGMLLLHRTNFHPDKPWLILTRGLEDQSPSSIFFWKIAAIKGQGCTPFHL